MVDQADSLRQRMAQEIVFPERVPVLHFFRSFQEDISPLVGLLCCSFAEKGYRVQALCGHSKIYFSLLEAVPGFVNHPNLNLKNLQNEDSEESQALDTSQTFDLMVVTETETEILSPKISHLCIFVAGPTQESAEACAERMKELRKRSNIKDFALIVNGVTTGAKGIEVYKTVVSKLGKFSGIEVNYLTHFPVIGVSKNLVESEREVRLSQCLELWHKRLQHWKLDLREPESTAVLAACRFRDEPVVY